MNRSMFRSPGGGLAALAALTMFVTLIQGCGTIAPGEPIHPIARPPAPLMLLGEVHDNAQGHARRLERLSALLSAGWRPAIVMEQFDRERQPDLDRAMRECPQADCVVQRAGAGGWNWAFYRPVIDLAIEHRLPVLAGNLSRAQASLVIRDGFGAVFDTSTISRFSLEQPLPLAVLSAQRSAIADGHCGLLPERLIDPMVRAQVARDIWMARQLLASVARGAVLLAGNGHVRRDAGVPFWLRGRPLGLNHATGYLESPEPPQSQRFDQVVPIEPQDRPDPCAALQRRMNPAQSPFRP